MNKTLLLSCLLACLSATAVAQQQQQQQEEDAAIDNSHIVISAIKTVSGEAPDNEFFALAWKVRFGDRFLSIADLDVALTNQGTDSVSASQKELTEAGILLALDIGDVGIGFNGPSPYRKYLKRTLYTGLHLKIFNAESYYGISAGSIELANSNFEGSYFQIGYMRRFFPISGSEIVLNDSEEQLSNNNIYTEFLIYSSEQNFFKYLTLRGGVLVPLLGSKGTFDDVQFRIVVSVPVGGLFKIDK